MKIEAAVLEEFNQPLLIEEKEFPSLENNQVLVRITACGVCGSDVHMWKGKDPRTPLPLILSCNFSLPSIEKLTSSTPRSTSISILFLSISVPFVVNATDMFLLFIWLRINMKSVRMNGSDPPIYI